MQSYALLDTMKPNHGVRLFEWRKIWKTYISFATDLLQFARNYDTYEFIDTHNTSEITVEVINDTVAQLLNDKEFHGICEWLYNIYSEESVYGCTNNAHESIALLRRLEGTWTR